MKWQDSNELFASVPNEQVQCPRIPTILVFGADKDSPIPYEGARTASAIESFALEQLETNVLPPEVTELTGPVSLVFQHMILYVLEICQLQS